VCQRGLFVLDDSLGQVGDGTPNLRLIYAGRPAFCYAPQHAKGNARLGSTNLGYGQAFLPPGLPDRRPAIRRPAKKLGACLSLKTPVAGQFVQEY